MSDRDLKALARVSASIGADPDLVQGGGGNSSLKQGRKMWIKASGTWLADAERRELFVEVALDRLRARIAEDAEDPSEGCFDAEGVLRPSIETTLHALLPHRVVLHAHAVSTIAWAVQVGGAAAVAERLREIAWCWVPYRRPGLPLTRAVAEALRTTPEADVLVLANHGLVVGGGDTEAAAERLYAVERRLALPVRAAPPARLDAPLPEGWRLPDDPLVHAIATDPEALRVAEGGPLYPDHVVFLDAALPSVEAGETFDAACGRHRAGGASAPDYLVLPGHGVVVRQGIAAGAEEMLRCLARVLLRIEPGAGVAHLGAADIDALRNWDAEQYRQSLGRDAP